MRRVTVIAVGIHCFPMITIIIVHWMNAKGKGPLPDYLTDYVLDQLCLTGVFGDYIDKNKFKSGESIDQNVKSSMLSNNDKVLLNCKSILFDIDKSDNDNKHNNSDAFNQFTSLLSESIKDINNSNDSNIEYYMQTRDSGLSNFIVNRLSLIIFNDLTCYDNKNDDNDALSYPKLKMLFHFYGIFQSIVIVIHIVVIILIAIRIGNDK